MPRNRSYDDDEEYDDEDWGEDYGDSDSDDDGNDTVPCPYCRRLIHEDSQRCPHCGHYISEEDASPRKPLWIVVGALLCLFCLLVGYARCNWLPAPNQVFIPAPNYKLELTISAPREGKVGEWVPLQAERRSGPWQKVDVRSVPADVIPFPKQPSPLFPEGMNPNPRPFRFPTISELLSRPLHPEPDQKP